MTETEDRALMFGFYTRQFIRPQVNWNALLAPEIRASFSSEMQTWLGLGIDGNRLGAEVYGKSIGKSAVETR